MSWNLSRSPPEADKALLQGGLCAFGAFKSPAKSLAGKSRPDQSLFETELRMESATVKPARCRRESEVELFEIRSTLIKMGLL